jgi:hypothetical protein
VVSIKPPKRTAEGVTRVAPFAFGRCVAPQISPRALQTYQGYSPFSGFANT